MATWETSTQIMVLDTTLQPQGVLTDYTSATFIPRMNAVGAFTITLNKEDPMWSGGFLEEGRGIWYQRTLDVQNDDGSVSHYVTNFAGPIWTFDERGKDNTVLLGGYDDLWWVAGRKTVPPGGSAFDAQSGVQASAAILHYMAAELTAATDSSRDLYGLSLISDPAIGSNVPANSRYTTLLTLLQYLSAGSSPELGCRIVPTGYGTRQFQVYAPAVSAAANFGLELGNILDYQYTRNGPTGNSIYVGDAGLGTSRVFRNRKDSASVTLWNGIVESFLDARDTTTTALLDARGDAQLATTAQTQALTIQPLDTEACLFGRDYDLGSIISVQTSSGVLSTPIRELRIQLDGQGQEIITPTIGAPLARATTDFSGNPRMGTTPKDKAMLDALAAQLNYIEGVQ